MVPVAGFNRRESRILGLDSQRQGALGMGDRNPWRAEGIRSCVGRWRRVGSLPKEPAA